MFKPLATLALAACTLLALPTGAAADTYPSKPVRLVVPFAPGGSTDVLARILAEELRAELGQTFIVENKPGAGGNIGGDMVARAPADGYTLLVAAAGPTVINPSLYRKMPYNPAKDLAPISLLVRDHNLMAVHPSVPAKTVQEFVAYARANPGKLAYGSPGNGTPAHLGGEWFNQLAGVNLQHVPYKGSGPAVSDLIAGQFAVMIDNMAPLWPHVQAGRLRALAVAGDKRAAAAPDLPTMQEQGMKGFAVWGWKALMAPVGTPQPVLDKLHAAAVKVLAKPAVAKRLSDLGSEPVGSTPAELATLVQQETRTWAALVKSTGASID